MFENEIYDKAFRLWGFDAQINMVIEEGLEFLLEVQRLYRNRTDNEALTKEIADIEIMIAQLKYIANISPHKLEAEKQRKLRRLKRLIRISEKNDANNG